MAAPGDAALNWDKVVLVLLEIINNNAWLIVAFFITFLFIIIALFILLLLTVVKGQSIRIWKLQISPRRADRKNKKNEKFKTTLALLGGDTLWNSWITPFVEESKPKTAYFIEYSAVNIRPIIDCLVKNGWHVNILLKNPKTVDGTRQKEKIRTAYQNIVEELGNKNITVSFYSTPGSIRARYIEDLVVSIGWYTYDKRTDEKEGQIWGHNNIIISARPEDDGWESMQKFVCDIFARMKEGSLLAGEVF